jgi:TolB protein
MAPAVLLLTVAAAPAIAATDQIAFMRDGKVWIITPEGAGERALTDTLPFKADRPINWMPDGRQILYWNHSPVGWDIWAATTDGREHRNLTRVQSGGCRSPAPSPDVKRIAFLRDDPPGLYLMDADGSNQRRLTDRGHRDFPPSWSPDGKRLAYTAEEGDRLSLRCFDLTTQRDIRVAPGSSPSWSPDGKHLVFGDVRDGVSRLYLIAPNGTDEVRLTRGPGYAWAPAWSPEGGRIAYFTSRDNQVDLWLFGVEQKTKRLLACVEGPWGAAASWSPDGKWLTFAAGPASRQVVYVVDVQGRGLSKLAAGGACYPVWQPAANRSH